MTSLTEEALPQLNGGVSLPRYDRRAVTTGIVHIGVGNFHRSHQAMYLDTLMNDGAALDWGICGIGLQPSNAAMRDALAAQDGLYTLVIRHGDGSWEPASSGRSWSTSSRPTTRKPPSRSWPTRRPASSPSLSPKAATTSTQSPVSSMPPTRLIQADLAARGGAAHALRPGDRGARPAPRPGRARLHRPVVRQHPGQRAHQRATFTAFARLRDPELADWIAGHVRFPNCMVDRITPKTTDEDRAELSRRFGIEDRWPVLCEPFTQWVLEDDFADGRPPLQDAGVQIVPDVEPYELMKLRLLNASHQALCYPGYLAGSASCTRSPATRCSPGSCSTT